MYDDAWYSTITSSASARQSSKRPAAGRRTSLLVPANDIPRYDDVQNDEGRDAALQRSASPPRATLERRARSYSDFYHAANSQLRKETKQQRQHRRASLSLRIQDKIKSHRNAYAFEVWRQSARSAIKDEKHVKYSLYRERLQLSRQHLDNLLDDTKANLDLLSELSTSFKTVDAQTLAFRGRCDTLVADQTKISSLADNVSQNLQYYNYLDPITRHLNAPGAGHLVQNEQFPEMLANLDQCIDYMESHPKQREAATYRSRYKLLLTRALTLIRVHFTNTLRETAVDVSTRITDRQLNDTTMPALLYAKFRVNAAQLKSLGLEIQRRASPPPNAEPGTQGEYQSLMNELYQSYSVARGRLIVPIMRRKMAEEAATPSSTSDLLTFVRSTIGYVRGICLDEYELWHEWFEGDDGLYDFLESMCEPLYDYLRPRVIKEPELAKLCEVCSLIQAQYMDEADDESDILSDRPQLDFASLIRPALEDAQTRLVFLAQSYLRAEIERFKPKTEELEAFARSNRVALSGSKSNGPALSGSKLPKDLAELSTSKEQTNGNDSTLDSETASTYTGWYPTLRKAIWLLSRIYRLVNSTVFDDLAHNIVHATTLSLEQASVQLSAKGKATESQLFLLRQLLILKSQIVAFDIEYVTPELDLDFSSFTSTFWELRERGGLFNASNLIKLVGGGLMPGVVENMLDAKVELDGKLRTVINAFIGNYASRFTAAISIEAAKKSGFQAATAVQEVRKTIEKETPLLRNKLDEHLDDLRTKETLVAAVQDQVLANYEDFFEKYKERAKANGTPIVSKKGKGREEEVWESSTFADWSYDVFGVRRVDEEDLDEQDLTPPLSRVTSA